MTDANGDGIITADEVANYSALLNFGLTTGYHVLMNDTTAAIEASDAYQAYLSGIGADPTNVVVGTISVEDGKQYFKAAEAFSSLVSNLFDEFFSAENSSYTFYPALTATPVGYLSMWEDATGRTATESMIEGVKTIEIGSPVVTYEDSYDRIQFYSPAVSSQTYGGNYHTYSVDQMYYYKKSSYLHAVVYDYTVGDFVECTVDSQNLQFYLTDSGYFTNSYVSWKNTRGIGALVYGAGGLFRGLHGKSCLVFNSLVDIHNYYNLESSIYVGTDAPKTVSQMLLDTLNSTDWTGLSQTLWDTVSQEVDDAKLLGAMSQGDFQQILDDNFSALDESINSSEEEEGGSASLDEIFEQMKESNAETNSILTEIKLLAEAIHGLILEGGSGATGSLDTTNLETIVQTQITNNETYHEEQKEQLETQHNELMEQNKTQHEENKSFFSSVTDFFGSFFDNLVDSVVGIFVPDDETMTEMFNELELFFEERFGFLYFPFDFLTDLFDVFINSGDSKTVLTFPGFKIMEYQIWNDMTYDLSSEPMVSDIFGYVRTGTGVLLAAWFVGYLGRFFDKRFGGGGN